MRFSKIIIDSNNLYHKAYSKAKSVLAVYDKKIINKTIEIFLNMLKKLETDLASSIYCEWYFLWDNPTSKLSIRSQMDHGILNRREMDSEYKKNRLNEDTYFYNGINYLRLLLQYRKNNYYDLQIESYEADDTVYALINYLKKTNNIYKIIIVSEDMDWSRCIEKEIFWYSKKKVWDKYLFNDVFGFFPTAQNIIIYKAIRGDRSDNIPAGIPNISEKNLLQIIKDFDNIYSFLVNYNSLNYLSNTIKNKIKERKHRLRLNYQLVDFIPIDISYIEKNLVKSTVDEKKLKKLYKIFNLSISKYENIRDNVQTYTLEDFFIKKSKKQWL